MSKRMMAAVEAVLYIACSAGGVPVRSKEICAYQGLALRYLEPIMQHLVQKKILRGVRGPKGGYVLAKEKRKIRVSDIMEVVETLDKSEGLNGEASHLHHKVLQPVWQEAGSRTQAFLQDITIEDLCNTARAENIDVAKHKKSDFTI